MTWIAHNQARRLTTTGYRSPNFFWARSLPRPKRVARRPSPAQMWSADPFSAADTREARSVLALDWIIQQLSAHQGWEMPSVCMSWIPITRFRLS
jgi:hypothetical protein